MSSVILHAFPSFYYKEGWNKFVALSSHPIFKIIRLNTYLRNVCRPWLQDQWGRMGVLGYTWWKEGGRAGCSQFQSFSPSGRLLWKGGRSHPTAAGNHTLWWEGASPRHSSAVHCFFRAVCQRATQPGVSTLSLLQAAQIPWHTCPLPSKGLGVGGGVCSKLRLLPISEGL